MTIKKYNLYGQDKVKGGTEYEVSLLPLQKYVSSTRKLLCGAWESAKVEKKKLTDSVESSVQSTNNKIKSTMQSVGVKDTRVAVGVVTVSTAAIAGLLFARKKSMAHQIMYPVLFGGLAWGGFYCSSEQNRTYIRSQIKTIQSGYANNTKSKNK